MASRQHRRSPDRARISAPGGFALVIALLVLALLVVTVVGSSLLLQVEVRTADNSRQIAEARQNALFGLNIALGELQQLAGPDQRVTATASLIRNTATSEWAPAGTVATNSPHRNWTGVWDTSSPRYIPDPSAPGKVVSNVGAAAGQLNPEPMAWLVSGGKNSSSASGNSTETSQVTPDVYPARVGPDGKPSGVANPDDHVVLLGSGSINLASNPEDAIAVPKVALLRQNANGSTSRSGSYAYWVADEGVKARFDAVESEAFATRSVAEQNDYRVLGAQRIGAEQISTGSGNATFSSIGYDPQDTGFLQKIRRFAAREHLGLLDHPGHAFRDAAKARFHDITTVSEGVLSDTRKGGLKQDLTVYLQGGSSLSANGTSLIADTDLLFSDSRDTTGVTDPKNPRAPLAVRCPGLSLTSNSTGLPKFGLLRTWYQMDAANPQITQRTSIQHGLYPVIVRAEWPIWMHVEVDMTGATFPFTLPRTAFTPRVHPVVTLWNPYNVALPGRDYLVKINIGSGGAVSFRSDGNQTMSITPHGSRFAYPLPSAIYLNIPASEASLGAGQNKIFTLRSNHAGYDGTSAIEMISGYFAPSANPTGSGLTDPPKATNQNGYFELPPPTGPDIIVPLNPGGGTKTLIGLGANAATTTPPLNPADPLRRSVSLYLGNAASSAIPGNLLQHLTPVTGNYSWIGSGPTDSNWLAATAPGYFNYSGPNSFDFFTRTPRSGWHIRPTSHYTSAWASMDWAGGSFSPLLDFNYRVGSDAAASAGSPAVVPFVDINAPRSERERFWGPYRYFQDGNNSDTIGPSANLLSPGGSPAYERYAYAFSDTLYKHPDTSAGPVTSTSFNGGTQLGDTIPLFDLKPAGRELVSLGYLQHANLAAYAWHPSYVLGNSWVNPQLAGRDRYSGFFSGTPAPAADAENKIYDISHMANESIWDRFFLSGANTGSSSLGAGLLDNTESLPNSRLKFRQSLGQNYNTLSTPADRLEQGAQFLTIDGAFNVNSTSVEAWKAFLSSRNGLGVNGTSADSDEAVFARMLKPGGGSGPFLDPGGQPIAVQPAVGQPAAEAGASYTGARKLSADEVAALAEKIVEQVKLRGPFSSLSDFVNRRLPVEPAPSASETETSRTGFVGPLQAAIDSATEALLAAGQSGLNSFFYNSSVPGSFYQVGKIPATTLTNPYTRLTTVDGLALSSLKGFFVPRLRMLGKTWYYSAAGVPGFLTQSDILSGLGHIMAVRSDTFTIRAYGETADKSGKAIAKVWCEAVVQRLPEPVKSNPSRAERIWPENPAHGTANPANALGRKFIIRSFRWLTPEEA